MTADPSIESRLDDVLRTLARRVRRLREERDLSLVALSYESGLSESRLRAIESGRTTASLATLVALAETFEIEVSELFAETAVPERSIDQVGASIEAGRSGDLPPAPWLTATPPPAATASAYVVPSEVVWGGDLPPAPWTDTVAPRDVPEPSAIRRLPAIETPRAVASDRIAATERTWGGPLPAAPWDPAVSAYSPPGTEDGREPGPDAHPVTDAPPRSSVAAHVHRRAAEQGMGGASQYVLVAPGAGAQKQLRTFADLREGPLQGRNFRSLREFAVAAVTEADHPLPAVARVFRLPVWRLEQWVVEAGYSVR
ncbi:helix-turn-helix domain-containing protein [uncultured Microbacterium sp.]|uniref:helix-turn-helix domain-containing protein n=1 Tax=uncultured Microbacterium sp. TaxID=191216 RepID=UPI0025FF0F0D|nr:helix-turn-helix transcriptional regulator [uncultured Microbacterium sp.]